MARPKPKILLKDELDKLFKSEEVIEAEGVYSVFYKNYPISLRTVDESAEGSAHKYKKVSFPSLSHAANLAERLNTKFNTSDFTVVKATDWETIPLDDKPSPDEV
jgi:hypothetical protein